MSCIAGVLRRDGAPADPRRVEAMLACMHGRAPDGDEVVCDGPLALGQAWLRIDGAPRSAAHPIRSDGTLWITADARIDGRAELLDALRAAGRPADADTPHAGLIAQAWRAWGPRMLEHLIGDFAFALWDAHSRTLVCARDHFGVRPLHYVDTPELFAFASDLDALRVLPQVSDTLDEASIADFLIFGTCLDPGRTIWRDARCLPPAHLLQVDAAKPATLGRYWDVPEPEPIRLRSQGEYVEAFTQVFTQAVTDRLPDGPVATHLSGGMDSTAIAAVAIAHARRAGHRVTAHHVSCHELLPEDEERHYAEMVASHLGLPLRCDELGRHPLFARSHDPSLATSMPFAYPHLAHHDDLIHQIAASGARVLLTGQGGDAVLTPSATYYGDLLRSGRWTALAREIAHHVRHTGSLAGMGLRSALLGRQAEPVWRPALPDWIDPAFARRVDFQARWDHAWKSYHGNIDAQHQLRQTWVSSSLQSAEVLKRPLVARHPFFDVRLVRFLLGLPNFMLVGKHVLRESMRGRLPEPVRTRPKISLVVDPVRSMVTDGKLGHVARPATESRGREYVLWDRHTDALRQFSEGRGSDSTWNNLLILAPIALKNWLDQQQKGLAT
ncbi:MAG: asparagine synthase-related protein [Pseudomonadota bacterium]